MDVKHALYRKTGNWYHQLQSFPGALLDEHGFVIFETEEAYRACPELRIKQDVGVPKGIASIPGYTRTSEAAVGMRQTYENATYLEGARRDVIQSRVERNSAAREACIAAHGTSCAVCGFSFAEAFGAIGDGFIHVHHCNPVSSGVREVDPVSEMRPLCPNCHAMAHREDPPISIERLKAIMREKP